MYGIVKRKNGLGSYVAKVPKETPQEFHFKQFAISRFDSEKKAKSAAAEWQRTKGIEIWGERIWKAISARKITVRRLWGRNFGVYVYVETLQGEWDVWRVEWRDPDTKENQCRIFSPKKYGDLQNAEIFANLFANKKRAELSFSDLTQPTHLIF